MKKRATFIIDKETLTKLRDFAYTERVGISETVQKALELFLRDKTGLIHKGGRP